MPKKKTLPKDFAELYHRSNLTEFAALFATTDTNATERGSLKTPDAVMSTAEAVAISSSIALSSVYFPLNQSAVSLIPGHLLGAVRKDDDKDATRLQAYWDSVVRRRAKKPAIKGADAKAWQLLWDRREDVMAQ